MASGLPSTPPLRTREGEVIRLRRANDGDEKFQNAFNFFEEKLVLRCYDRDWIKALLNQKPRCDSKIKVRKAFLKVTFNSTLNAASLNRALRRHAHVLEKSCGKQFFVLAKSVRPNLFRRLYRRSWNKVRAV